MYIQLLAQYILKINLQIFVPYCICPYFYFQRQSSANPTRVSKVYIFNVCTVVLNGKVIPTENDTEQLFIPRLRLSTFSGLFILLMFSLQRSIDDYNVTIPELPIDYLQWMIKSNPHKETISELHTLAKGTTRYKEIKDALPCVKPHGTFNRYATTKNFKNYSGYIFIDIDKGNIAQIKAKLIKEYSDKVYMLGKSVGGVGLFAYVKIANKEKVTADNFLNVQKYVVYNLFKEFVVDPNSLGLARNHVIPYDPELLVNENASVLIPNHVLNNNNSESKKCATSCNKEGTKENVYTTKCTFLDIKEVNKHIVWKTVYDIGDKDYVVEDYEQAKLYVPRIIADGDKHRKFKAMVHVILFNNPAIELKYVVSFIHFINQNYTNNQPMKQQEMVYTVTREFEKIKETGEFLHTKTRHVKTNPKLNGKERQRLGAKGVGEWKIKESIRLIKIAIDELKEMGITPTKTTVTAYMKDRTLSRSRRTIAGHWDAANQTESEPIKPINFNGKSQT